VRHWHSIESGLSRVLSNVMGWFKALPGRILHALGDLGSLLWNVGKQIVGGLIHGIESQFDKVKNMLGKLTSLLPSWKGPPARDKTLLFGNGQLLIDGLNNGITSRVPSLKTNLGNVTTAIQRGVQPRVSAAGSSAGGFTMVNNITVNAPTGDAAAIGRTIVQQINTYFRQSGHPNLANT
jgi:phage-related protein